MDGRDRRQFPRLEGQFEVDLLNMGDDPMIDITECVVPATALDISKHGIRLESNYNVAVGSAISVIAYYRRQGSVCLCDVVWKRGAGTHGYLYGLYIKSWGRLDKDLDKKLSEMEAADEKENAKTLAGNPESVQARRVGFASA